MIGAPEGRKVGSLKRRVRSQLARWEMNNCTPLWREAHCEVKMYKTHHSRTTFGSWDVEKVHAVVARSTLRSENVQNTPCSDHFWQLRCRKSARRCGAKHISKSKCTKHTMLGPLLEVEMSKKCTPLWCEGHLEVKMLKTLGFRNTFGSSDLEKVHAVVARSTFWSQNVKKARGSTDHFWRLSWTCLLYCACHGKCVIFKCPMPAIFCRNAAKPSCVAHLWQDPQSRASATRNDIWEVGRSGCWFPERGYILEYQKCRFAKMILHNRCSISYDLTWQPVFVAGAVL